MVTKDSGAGFRLVDFLLVDFGLAVLTKMAL